ncbi:hypothetical protein CA951_13710 [Rhodococcus sp. NCIMB 12038]|nr:hypothetical protein CA951_13710 [Rhodococcus sp. NCIMB 12038]
MSTGLLARHPHAKTDLSGFAGSARHDNRPRLMPIGRWGHIPYAPTPLTVAQPDPPIHSTAPGPRGGCPAVRKDSNTFVAC